MVKPPARVAVVRGRHVVRLRQRRKVKQVFHPPLLLPLRQNRALKLVPRGFVPRPPPQLRTTPKQVLVVKPAYVRPPPFNVRDRLRVAVRPPEPHKVPPIQF